MVKNLGMARTSLIDTLGIADLCAVLHFDEGKTVEETAAALNKYLADVRGLTDVAVSKSTVGRWVKDERTARSARTNNQIREWAENTVQSDLETLDMLKAWHLSVWEKSPDIKEKRMAAKDCVEVIQVKLRIAQAADSGDKTEIYQILKNEVNTVASRNPVKDILAQIAGATRGLPNISQNKLLADAEVIDV